MRNGAFVWVSLALGVAACAAPAWSGGPPPEPNGATGTSGNGTYGDYPPPGVPDPSCRGGGGGPSGGPADLFPCDSPWYQDVSHAQVAGDSQAITQAIGAFGSGRMMIDFSFVFFHADASTPRHRFTVDYTDESDDEPVPVPPNGALEGEDGYTCDHHGDCHLIVVDDANKKLFELWSVDNAAGPYEAAQLSVWDLTRHYGPDGRGLGCTSADAAGLAILPGLIGFRETKAGAIRHALRFILPNSKIRSGPSFVAPATHGTKSTSSSGGPAYGMRLRLKPSFDESTITSAGGKAVVRALKTYGMILADGGQIALTAESDRFHHAQDPSLTWEGLLGSADLKAITPADFDVLDHGPVQSVTDCAMSH